MRFGFLLDRPGPGRASLGRRWLWEGSGSRAARGVYTSGGSCIARQGRQAAALGKQGSGQGEPDPLSNPGLSLWRGAQM